MPCCSCNGKRALCKGCSTCAKGKKVCIDCYPGRKGKCANASITPTASQTLSQPLLPIPSPSCSSAQASQPSLQVIPLLSTRPSPTVDDLPPCCLPMKHNRCANRALTLAESALVGTVTFFSNRYLRYIIYIIGKSKKYTFQRYLMFIVISFVASTTLFQRCNTK